MRDFFQGAARTIRGLTTPEVNTDSVYTSCRVGPVFFDQRHGHGATSATTQLLKRGFVAMMKPSDYFNMLGQDITQFHGDNIYNERLRVGEPIASPYLVMDFSGEIPEVMGHEGRNRMGVIANLYGDMTAMPVGIHLTSKTDRKSVSMLDVMGIKGPLQTQFAGRIEQTGVNTIYFGKTRYELDKL